MTRFKSTGKTFKAHHFMRNLLLAAMWIALISAIRADTTTPPRPDASAGNVDLNGRDRVELQRERLAFAQAKQLLNENKSAQAVLVLAATNVSKANTAEYHMETAQRLLTVSEESARNGEPAMVTVLAGRALEQLVLSETLARDPEERASARTLAGFIQERYLADPTAALLSYRAAVQFAPEKASKAKESVERLKQTEDNLREKNARRNGR